MLWLRRHLAPAIALIGALALRPATVRAWTFDWSGRVDLDAEGLRSDDPATRREAVQLLSGYDIRFTEVHLLGALNDPVLDVRLDAARALGRGGSQPAVAVLIEWLGDVEVKTRIAAAEALGDIGGAQASSALTRSLGDVDHGVRQRAVRSLGAIGKRGDTAVVISLLPRLSDDKADVRRETVEQLEAIADRRAVIPLVAAFSDNHPEVRKAAVRAVGRFGDASVVPALLRLLRDPSEEVRSAAVGSLGTIGSAQAIGALSDLLPTGSDLFRSKVAYALGQIARDPSAGKAAEVALERLVAALAVPTLRTASREALRAAGPVALPSLLQHLSGRLPGDPTTVVQLIADAADPRATAALTAELERRRVALPLILQALGATRDPEALVPMLSALGASEPEIRLAAMNAMRPLLGEDGRAADVLIERLADPDLEVRVLAAEYLGLVRARQAMDKLIALTAAGTPGRLRLAAIHAIGEIGDPRGLDAALEVLRDGPSSLRSAAATAISYIGDRRALPILLRMLGDSPQTADRFVVRSIAGSLRPQPAPSLHRPPKPTAPSVATSPASAIARLLTLSKDGPMPVAVAAIAALAAAADLSALPALRTVASSGAPDRRRAALTALADLDDHQALPLALDALSSSDDRVSSDAAWVVAMTVAPGIAPGASPGDAGVQAMAWDRLSFAAKRGGWATSINATAGLARLARRLPGGALTPERASALHLLAFHRSPLVRCNIGLALIDLARPSNAEAGRDLLRLLKDDSSARVRATVAAALSRRRTDASLSEEQSSALATSAASDPSEAVRTAAKASPRAELARVTSQWRIFEIVDSQANDAPVRQHPYFMQGHDGLIRAVYTDSNGEIVGERMPSGQVDLLPASRETDF
jgi:HEAT repeat protein